MYGLLPAFRLVQALTEDSIKCIPTALRKLTQTFMLSPTNALEHEKGVRNTQHADLGDFVDSLPPDNHEGQVVNKIHQITSKSLRHCSQYVTSCWKRTGKIELKEPGRQKSERRQRSGIGALGLCRSKCEFQLPWCCVPRLSKWAELVKV